MRAQGRAKRPTPGMRSRCAESRFLFKYHQRQPRPHHLGPNGIDRPSLTGYSKQAPEKKG